MLIVQIKKNKKSPNHPWKTGRKKQNYLQFSTQKILITFRIISTYYFVFLCVHYDSIIYFMYIICIHIHN